MKRKAESTFHVVCYSYGRIWIDGVRKIAPAEGLVAWAKKSLGNDSPQMVEFYDNGTYSIVERSPTQEQER